MEVGVLSINDLEKLAWCVEADERIFEDMRASHASEDWCWDTAVSIGESVRTFARLSIGNWVDRMREDLWKGRIGRG